MRKFKTLFSRFFAGKDAEQQMLQRIDRTKLPRHLAIIMDGNGRWAQKRGLPRSAGHRAGVEALRKVIEACVELKVPVLTVYAFSTENWKRPKAEVNVLMTLMVEYLRKEINELCAQNIRIRPMGYIDGLPEEAKNELKKAAQLTRGNKGLNLNVALNYGGRMEIVEAAKTAAQKVLDREVTVGEINEDVFASFLFTAGQPDPDLLIRPSGERRISNFLLWQLAYAEFYYTNIFWPDFNKFELLKAITEFQQRNRRYGGIP